MKIYGIRSVIQRVEKELYELDYSVTKDEIRKHGSNVFILIENVVKELVYIYEYLLYKDEYKFELNEKNKKIMLGKAINKLIQLNKSKSKDILIRLNRNYLIYSDEYDLIKSLRNISKIRGEIFHEYGINIDDISLYKDEVRKGIIESFNTLKFLKDKNIFPDIVVFDYLESSSKENIVYFKDEINSKIPMAIDLENIESIKLGKWYIFRNLNELIPVKNNIDAFTFDTIEKQIMSANVTKQKPKWHYIEIDKEKIFINKEKTYGGRLKNNDVLFSHRSISRKHFLIEKINFDCYLVDLESKFGTYLNDIKVIPHERMILKDKDEIEIGKGVEKVKITYRMGESELNAK